MARHRSELFTAPTINPPTAPTTPNPMAPIAAASPELPGHHVQSPECNGRGSVRPRAQECARRETETCSSQTVAALSAADLEAHDVQRGHGDERTIHSAITHRDRIARDRDEWTGPALAFRNERGDANARARRGHSVRDTGRDRTGPTQQEDHERREGSHVGTSSCVSRGQRKRRSANAAGVTNAWCSGPSAASLLSNPSGRSGRSGPRVAGSGQSSTLAGGRAGDPGGGRQRPFGFDAAPVEVVLDFAAPPFIVVPSDDPHRGGAS